jgi:hypothetical protein
MVIIALFCAPLAMNFFAQSFFPEHPNTPIVEQLGLASPFAAAFAVPLDMGLTAAEAGSTAAAEQQAAGNWPLFIAYVVFTLGLNGTLLLIMMWLFNVRWRVAG